ncbi:hypothetical protein [Hyphomicrobium sp. ghe19]|uniref:hypothetical protein n=1 Tax=Hyphomicrobium sp. ghe19 TaxID=2682968 RepID=UPI001366C1CD|nr:hypothetical protein HYPP_02968 [Hyphomicrobium sp. ghe19]
MLISVFALVILTTVIAGKVLVPRFLTHHVRLANAPDQPRAFGRDMAWLAIQTDDSDAVAAALGLTGLRPANWDSGIGAIYDPEVSAGLLFISPPVRGWTIVAGEALPVPAGSPFIDKMTPLLKHLGKQFRNVQYFASFPIIDFYAWARADKGRPKRAFAIGEAGIVWDLGKPTPEERQLGLSYVEIRGITERHGDVGGQLVLHPTEENVFAVAAGWSLNPMTLEGFKHPRGVGWIADAPRSWRPERARRVA